MAVLNIYKFDEDLAKNEDAIVQTTFFQVYLTLKGK